MRIDHIFKLRKKKKHATPTIEERIEKAISSSSVLVVGKKNIATLRPKKKTVPTIEAIRK